MKVRSFFFRLYSLDVQVLENGRICTSFGHVEEPYIKSNTHHFACKLHLEGAEKKYIFFFQRNLVFHSNKAKLSARAQSYHHRYQSAARRIDLPGFTSKKLKNFSFALQNIFSKSVRMGLRWHQMHLCIKEKEHLSC